MQVSVEIQGLKELERKLIAMGPKVGLKAMRSALVSGAQVIKKDAISRVPVKTGTLKRAVLVKRLTKTNPFKENVIVGVRHGKKYQSKDSKRNRDAFYWTWIEFGTKERYHKKTGKSVGSTPKQEFIRPAFEAKKNSAMTRIVDVLKRKIAQYAKEPA
jgi:HK97 gp10 family phage protein